MGHEGLDELATRAGSSGVFLDYDGTLSEIAPTPAEAVALPGATEVLDDLAERFRVVAVVSGRRLSELEHSLGHPKGVRLFGLYGLEGEEGGDDPIGAGARAVEEVLPRVLELAAGINGAMVEPKGSNLAVHYRLARDREAARAALLSELEPLARASGLELIEGKRVLELVPAAAPTKGDLIAREGRGLEGVLFAGDDAADLDAFAAVDRLAADGAHAMKVAVRTAETPAQLLRSADLVVEGPAGLLEALRSLAR